MMRTVFAIFLFLLNFSFFTSGCGFADSKPYIRFKETEQLQPVKQSYAKETIQPLRMVVSSVLPYKETSGYYRRITEHLAIQIGRPTELIQRQSNMEVSILLANGGADIALFSTGTYVSYAESHTLEALAMQQRLGTPFYYSYVVVHKDTDIITFASLRGKSFAFTDTLSFSGYLIPSYMLRRSGMTPEQFFSRYLFTYSHMKSLRAVAEGVVDGAAIDSSVYEYAKERYPDLIDAVRIISTSMPIGTGPVVVKKDMNEDQKELLRSVLLNMHHNADMRQTLKGLMIDRFIAPNPEYFKYPGRITQEMRSQL
jgi:phosphonate transport system substrate-binding protein